MPIAPDFTNFPSLRPPEMFAQIRMDEIRIKAPLRPAGFTEEFMASASFMSLDGQVLYIPMSVMSALSRKYNPKPEKQDEMQSPWLRIYTGTRSVAEIEEELLLITDTAKSTTLPRALEFRARAVQLITENSTSPCRMKTLLARIYSEYVERLNHDERST